MTTSNTIAAALRENVANARTKAGRKFAQGQLDAYLSNKPRKPFQASPFSRFVESLMNVPDVERRESAPLPSDG